MTPDRLALTAGEGRTLTTIAERAIRAALADDAPFVPVLDDVPPALRHDGASFVSLHRDDALLGCIGSIEPTRPLAADVADNAVGAAFRDPRLPALTPPEFVVMSIEVAVLSALAPVDAHDVSELLAALRPGVDGVLIDAPRHRATFLPVVWHQVADADDFVQKLWTKAGLAHGAWPNGLRVERYTTVEFVDPGPRAPVDAVPNAPDRRSRA